MYIFTSWLKRMEKKLDNLGQPDMRITRFGGFQCAYGVEFIADCPQEMSGDQSFRKLVPDVPS